MIKDKVQKIDQNIYKENKENENLLLNFLRCLIMLEKKLERIARQNYNNRSQYPVLFIEIEQAILTVRAWIECHKIFSGFPIFQTLLAVFLKSITEKVVILIETSRPVKGKKAKKNTFRARQQEQLYKSVELMIGHLIEFKDKIQIFEEPMSDKIEEGLRLNLRL
ncbi:Uncharacterized protein dnl_41630 [Desulfonema limicola]|uniref:Uncharacterized protein n=1 Tax=Desulfonema limicola TaxID=45656 RepID=A0A975BAN3_9BACT|nr:hypothetical protein [Desulfonema limicola]QTA81812.1 Uncharacterized protein dnl_41630 [Desulfonema limicola]